MSLTVPTPHTIRGPKGRPPPRMVEQDVFNVAQRIKEIDSRLFVMLFEGAKKPWVVYEETPEGPQVVSRYSELTPSILEDLRYMAAVPFMERFQKLTDEIDAENDKREAMPDDKFERFAYDFRKALVAANMVDTPDFTSFPITRKRR